MHVAGDVGVRTWKEKEEQLGARRAARRGGMGEDEQEAEENAQVVDCPAGIVGRIIGKGGETIKALQLQSGAHISIDQDYPEGMPRKITVKGKKEKVERGVKLVNDLIRGGPGATAQVLAAVPGGTTQVVECPKATIGRVIGRGGETIKRLQATSGARIQINQTEEPMKITISGHQDCVQLAAAMVADIIGGGTGNIATFPYGFQGYGYPPPYPMPYPQGYMYPSGYPYPQPYMYPGFDPYMQPTPGAGQMPPMMRSGGSAMGASAKEGSTGMEEGKTQGPKQTWFKMQDPEGRVYYYNAETGSSQWEAPENMET